MATRFQVAFDCADPSRQTRFWAEALGYVLQAPPSGHESWISFWRSIGVPEDELEGDEGADSIVDPEGRGPRVFFQRVPEGKVVKNRVHLDLDVGGGRELPLATRKARVLAEADRLTAAGASALRVLERDGLDHFAVVMQDPEGNEFCLH